MRGLDEIGSLGSSIWLERPGAENRARVERRLADPPLSLPVARRYKLLASDCFALMSGCVQRKRQMSVDGALQTVAASRRGFQPDPIWSFSELARRVNQGRNADIRFERAAASFPAHLWSPTHQHLNSQLNGQRLR
jgi:hypothetical protein